MHRDGAEIHEDFYRITLCNLCEPLRNPKNSTKTHAGTEMHGAFYAFFSKKKIQIPTL